MNNRLRLLNHRVNRLNRPERIREAIVKATGDHIRVNKYGNSFTYKDVTFNNRIYSQYHIIILDNPEEGD